MTSISRRDSASAARLLPTPGPMEADGRGPHALPDSSTGCIRRRRADPDPAPVINIRDEPCFHPAFPRVGRRGYLTEKHRPCLIPADTFTGVNDG